MVCHMVKIYKKNHFVKENKINKHKNKQTGG